MPRITDVVKHLLVINVLMYFGTQVIMGEPSPYIMNELVNYPDLSRFMEWRRNILALFFPTSDYFQPYQVITHMFMHGDITHLLFNMYGLYLFGSAVEMTWGPKRFLFYYLFAGFGAFILHMLVAYLQVSLHMESPLSFNVPMLGASGAIFGLLAAFGMLYPNNQIMLLIPPIPMKAKYFVLVYGVIELFMGLGNFQQGVAHFAHLGGAISGVILILYWRKFGTNL